MKKVILCCGFVVAAGLSGGCGGSVKGSGGAGGDGGSAGSGGAAGAAGEAGMGGIGGMGGAAGVGGSAAGGGPAIQCTGTMPVFPAFDKSCSSKDDCTLKFHMVSCCGDMLGIGMNSAEGPAFDAAEAVCQMQYPACGCASGPPKAEDGKAIMQSIDEIQVDCMSGKCNSFIP